MTLSSQSDAPVAVITGAAGGIGTETAKRFARGGARVVVVDIHEEGARAVAAELIETTGIAAIGLAVDVTDPSGVTRMRETVVEAFGRIDHLVNCAGISQDVASADQSIEEWRRVLDLNLTGTFLCCRELRPALAGGGTIVNISSVTGFIASRPEVHSAYDATKAAVVALTRTLAAEWAAEGIRVNAVAPGYTNTDILKRVGSERPEVVAAWIDQIPMRRLVEPAEIAEVIHFLASPLASAVNGTTVVVDGGYLASK